MNGAHLHLIVNHLPVVGLIFAVGLMLAARLWGSVEQIRVSLFAMVFTALTAVPAYFSGEEAEEVVEKLPGITEQSIAAHEERAELALIATLLTGGIAIAGLFLGAKKPEKHKVFLNAAIGAGVISMGLMGTAANLGGQIRHTEIRDGASAAVGVGDGKVEGAKAKDKDEDKDEH